MKNVYKLSLVHMGKNRYLILTNLYFRTNTLCRKLDLCDKKTDNPLNKKDTTHQLKMYSAFFYLKNIYEG
jgi:hypothetical protein